MAEFAHHRCPSFWILFGAVCLVGGGLLVALTVSGDEETAVQEAYSVVCPDLEAAVAYAEAGTDRNRLEAVKKDRGCDFVPVTGTIYIEKRATVGGQGYYCLRHEQEDRCGWKREITGTPEGAAG